MAGPRKVVFISHCRTRNTHVAHAISSYGPALGRRDIPNAQIRFECDNDNEHVDAIRTVDLCLYRQS